MRGEGATTKVRLTMSSTPDWMRGGETYERPVRAGLPLGAVLVWTLALAIVADGAMALLHYFS